MATSPRALLAAVVVAAAVLTTVEAQLFPDLQLDVISFTPATESTIRGRDAIR